jgi:hypothetical protein
MPDYRRNRVPGGTFLFTVNLLDRRSDLVVMQIDTLRAAMRQARVASAPLSTSTPGSSFPTTCTACANRQRLAAECATLFRPTLAIEFENSGAKSHIMYHVKHNSA